MKQISESLYKQLLTAETTREFYEFKFYCWIYGNNFDLLEVKDILEEVCEMI